MDITIHVGKLTEAQEVLLERYENAASLLRAAGIPARVVTLCAFDPKDNPAYIVIGR